MDDQNKNLILATALSFIVILVWTIFFAPEPPVTQPVADNGTGTLTAPSVDGVASAPPAPGSDGTTATPGLGGGEIGTRDGALSASQRIDIQTPRLTGSLSLEGGRIDDLALVGYRETLDPGADLVTLLSL